MIDINSIRITENDPTRIVEGKVIYPQLLSPGIHKIPLENLEQKLLIPFDEKRTRSYLCNRLRELIQELESYNIEMIIWLDGSLCSIKPHPNDIDIIHYSLLLRCFEDRFNLFRKVFIHNVYSLFLLLLLYNRI